MSDPVCRRREADLEGKVPPHASVVAIGSTRGEDVEGEMTGPRWGGFVADLEARARDAVHLAASRIIA